MTSEKRNDEIDLIEVASKAAKLAGKASNKLADLIVLCFRALFTALIFSIRFLFKNSIIIILFVIIGYLAGTLYLKIAKPYYRTTATIQSNVIANASLIDYINRIHTLAANKDSISLAEQLNMSVSDAANIKDLEGFWMIDKNKDGIADEIDYENKFSPDTVTNSERIGNKFIVRLLAYESEIIPSVQTGLQLFIDTYPRINRIAEVKKENLQVEINRINSEIVILDSLRKYEYFVKDKELREYDKSVIKLNELLFKVGTDKEEPARLLHSNIIELNDQNLANIRDLELGTEPYIFLSSFIKVNNPVNLEQETGIRTKITILFFILSIFGSVFFRYRKSIFEFLKG